MKRRQQSASPRLKQRAAAQRRSTASGTIPPDAIEPRVRGRAGHLVEGRFTAPVPPQFRTFLRSLCSELSWVWGGLPARPVHGAGRATSRTLTSSKANRARAAKGAYSASIRISSSCREGPADRTVSGLRRAGRSQRTGVRIRSSDRRRNPEEQPRGRRVRPSPGFLPG
jgi:hypothetical protein